MKTYLEQMKQQLVDKGIRENPQASRSVDAARDAARVWTLTTLRQGNEQLKQPVAELSSKNRVLKKSLVGAEREWAG